MPDLERNRHDGDVVAVVGFIKLVIAARVRLEDQIFSPAFHDRRINLVGLPRDTSGVDGAWLISRGNDLVLWIQLGVTRYKDLVGPGTYAQGRADALVGHAP